MATLPLRGSGPGPVSVDPEARFVDFNGIGTVDVLLVLYFLAFFVLGFAQGTIRRLLGIGSILFSFLLAANLAGPLGDFLGSNWTQFPTSYSYMIAFGTVFVAGSIAFALVIQGFYRPQALFQKSRFADEIIGGILGLVQAALILGCSIVILDSYYRIPGLPPDPQELPFLRDLWVALDGTRTVAFFRDTIIPAFFLLTGFLVPDSIESAYPRG